MVQRPDRRAHRVKRVYSMGIVSEPWAKGRALWPPTTGTPAGTGGGPRVDRGWTEGGPRARGGSPGFRRVGGDARGQRHATGGLMRCPGLGPAPSPSRDRDVARPEDGDDAQAPGVTHRALADVHARHAEHEGGHGLRRELSRTARVLRAPAAAPKPAPGIVPAWPRAPGWRGTRSGGSGRSRRGGRAGGSGEGTRRPGASSSSGGSPRV